jgi:transcriptional regulator with XRE-family HTH domain
MKINGEALKAIRERSGMSITGLANASGVDRTVVTRIESGERRGTPAQHKALSEALMVPMQAIAYAEAVA